VNQSLCSNFALITFQGASFKSPFAWLLRPPPLFQQLHAAMIF